MGFRPFVYVLAPEHDLKGWVLNDEKGVTIAAFNTPLSTAPIAALALLLLKISPMTEEVRGVCDLLGFDPFYLANEGKLIAFVPQEKAERVFDAMKADPLGRESVIIGRVVDDNPGKVLLKTRIGGHRLLEPLSGEQFPRIC